MHSTQVININSADFLRNEYAYYRWMRAEAPVSKARMGRLMQMYVLACYDDVLHMLKDSRFVRNRTTVTGKARRTPIPLPKIFEVMTQSMIIADEPDHRRLRNLVHQAFTPRTVATLEDRIQSLANDLLDRAEQQGTVDLLTAYAQPIPVTVIAELLGIPEVDRAAFRQWTGVFTRSLNLRNMLGLYRDMRAIVTFIRDLIVKRRADPGDNLITALIQAEDAGQQLTEDELVSMVMLLLVAGYETTINLIANGTHALLTHPDQLARLHEQPTLIGTAVEEILRFTSPVASTKPNYTTEAVTMGGVTIPQGAMVLPLLASANRDERIFADPDTFDITRTPNKHLGFGHGIHFCLGAPLARLEGKIALGTLFARYPHLRLGVPPADVRYIQRPLLHRLESLPVTLA